MKRLVPIQRVFLAIATKTRRHERSLNLCDFVTSWQEKKEALHKKPLETARDQFSKGCKPSIPRGGQGERAKGGEGDFLRIADRRSRIVCVSSALCHRLSSILYPRSSFFSSLSPFSPLSLSPSLPFGQRRTYTQVKNVLSNPTQCAVRNTQHLSPITKTPKLKAEHDDRRAG